MGNQILNTRSDRGISEVLVMWVGYDSNFWTVGFLGNAFLIMEMHRNQFYITLFSNAFKEMFPDNSLAAFTIHLAQSNDLGTTSDWEVGLT